MNFFNLNKNKDTQEAPIPQPRQEWVRQESLRQQRPRELMNAQQLQRTREAKRLAETKRNNLEESIQRLREQQEWLRRYTQLTLRLKEEKNRLYQLNKEQNLMYREQQDLLRYESFESIQGDFERMLILKELVEENRREQSGLGLEMESLQHQWEEQLQRMKQRMDEHAKAATLLHQSQDQIAQAHFMDGRMDSLSKELDMLKELSAQYLLHKEAIEQQCEAQSEENELLRAELERLRAGRQSIEMYEGMIAHAESILVQLDHLSELRASLNTYTHKQQERGKKQNELNEQLGRIFKQYQEAEAQLQTLNDELSVHRRDTKGQDSYQLQERAMKLKSRRHMLLSAMSLWNRISTGYTIIEEKRQQLNTLRLKIEHADEALRKLDSEIDLLGRMCHEKEYTYLLSKGQDIIQLRADLREGTNCPVCGATHHPYHSDTMLEQSKLINEFKTEYELLHAELQSKEALRTDLRLELSEMQGQRKAEEATLLTALQRQEEDVKEWQFFSTLDLSFQDCTSGTNREARMAMLRQLIVNTTKDVEDAQQQLDTFNYRQGRITELLEKISALEQQKNDLGTRLNEVNTGCQVIAGQVDYMQDNIDHANRQFRQQYEALGVLMAIPEWFGEWERNNENLKQRILQLSDSWAAVNKNITHTAEDLRQGENNLATLDAQIRETAHTIETLASRRKECANLIEEYRNRYEKAVGPTSAKDFYEQLHSQMTAAAQGLSREQEHSVQLRQTIDSRQGRIDTITQWSDLINEQHAQQRQKLDLWIHNYNAQHPPVQYTELEQIFRHAGDWNALRQRVRTLHTDILLCQSKIEQMQAELTVMQAENGRISMQEDDAHIQTSLVSQRTSLEQKLHEITLQIARLDIALEEHEKATLESSDE